MTCHSGSLLLIILVLSFPLKSVNFLLLSSDIRACGCTPSRFYPPDGISFRQMGCNRVLFVEHYCLSESPNNHDSLFFTSVLNGFEKIPKHFGFFPILRALCGLCLCVNLVYHILSSFFCGEIRTFKHFLYSF